LIASCRGESPAATRYPSPPSLGDRFVLKELVGAKLDLAPRVLNVFALAESRTNGDAKEVIVFDLGRYEMNDSGAVDFLEQSFVNVVGSLESEADESQDNFGDDLEA